MADENPVAKKFGTKQIIIVVLVLLVLGGLGYAYKNGSLPMLGGVFAQNKTVAVVNGEEIKEGEVNTRFNQLKASYEAQNVDVKDETILKNIRESIVTEIVNEILVAQHAKDTGVVVTSEEIESQFGQIKAAYASDSVFYMMHTRKNLHRHTRSIHKIC